MGCLLSCCSGTEEDDNGEYGPNTPLLSDCNTQVCLYLKWKLFIDNMFDFVKIPTGNSDDYNYANNMAHSLPRQNDETSKGRFLRKLSSGSLMKYGCWSCP